MSTGLEVESAAVLTPRIRAARRARMRAAMDRYDLDALVVFEYANGRFVADLRPLYAPNFLVRQAVVLTRASEDEIVFVHQDDTPHRRQTMTWVAPERIREFPTGAMLEGDATALSPIAEALRELGFTSGRVGTDIGTPASLGNLTAALPGSSVVDANGAMHWARMVKSPDEVELLRRASRIVDEALAVAVDAARPGRLECEVLADVMHVFYRHNAEVPQCNLIVCTGANTSPMQRYAGDTAIASGDLVFMDIGACFDGMFSEATRTIVAGVPNDRQREVYQLVHRMHEDLIGAIGPGVTGADLQRVAAHTLAGNPDARYLQRMIIAHGIGVGYAEPPFIAPPGRVTPDLVLAPGMVLAVVPTILAPGVPGGGGVRLEDVVVVTEDGVERLTRFPYAAELL